MKNQVITQDRRHMATTFSFRISCASERLGQAKQILRESHDLVAELESKLSEFREESPVYQLNNRPQGTKIAFNVHAFHLLMLSKRLGDQTSFKFDVLAKGTCKDFSKVHWEADERLVWTSGSGIHLGFGAIGKGYALDRVREIIERQGFQDFLLSAGGSSQIVSGFRDREIPWSIGWSYQKDAEGNPLGQVLESHTGECISLGVSGAQEQGEHILNRSAKLESVLALHSSATLSDAFSTAIFAGGWETVASEALREEQPGVALVDEDGNSHWNTTFEKYFGSLQVLILGIVMSASAFAEEEIDLGELGLDDFNPYIFDRNPLWVLLPVAMAVFLIYHLKKVVKPNIHTNEESHDSNHPSDNADTRVIPFDRGGGSR